VEHDRRGGRDARLRALREDLLEVLVVVGEPGKDRGDEDARRPGGVPGSTTRRTRSSSMPTLMETVTLVTSLRRRKTSRSRRISVDLVSIDIGFAKSASASSTPRVSR
jgi:hypothetical protein